MRKQPHRPDPRRRPPGERPGLAIPQPTAYRPENIEPPTSRQARLEAALFLADEPLSAKKLIHAAGLPDADSFALELAGLRERFDRDGTPFQIRELAGCYQLLTRPEYAPWLARHFPAGDALKFGPAPLEVLAIVAYRQPITRAEVDQLRGVQSQEILNQLVERGLVRLAGRHDSLGRPVLYGTTRQFLQTFGLNAVEELPDIG